MLTVPYHSQEDRDAHRYCNDCGAACAAMLLEWAGKGRMSIDQLAAKTALSVSDDGLNPTQVANLLVQMGLPAQAHNGSANFGAIQAELAAGRPVITLIHYGSIPERQNQPDTVGHFVVVVGIDGDSTYLNDPDWWGNKMSYGGGLKVKTTEFQDAIARSPIPNSGIFLTPAATAVPVTPPKHSVPPGPAHVNDTDVTLRNGAAGAPISTLKQNDNVNIQPVDPVNAAVPSGYYTWVKIQTSDGTMGWVAENFLTAGYAPAAS
jgi:hypothetical protein